MEVVKLKHQVTAVEAVTVWSHAAYEKPWSFELRRARPAHLTRTQLARSGGGNCSSVVMCRRTAVPVHCTAIKLSAGMGRNTQSQHYTACITLPWSEQKLPATVIAADSSRLTITVHPTTPVNNTLLGVTGYLGTTLVPHNTPQQQPQVHCCLCTIQVACRRMSSDQICCMHPCTSKSTAQLKLVCPPQPCTATCNNSHKAKPSSLTAGSAGWCTGTRARISGAHQPTQALNPASTPGAHNQPKHGQAPSA